MNKDGIPLPSALSGQMVQRLVEIDEALLFLVTGALAELADDWRFEETGALTSEGAKDAISTMLWCFMEACEVVSIGSISMYAGATPPDKWLLCEGQSLLRADYADLFDIIGVGYGFADSTHFNLPDMRFRSPMHPGTSADTLDTLGLAGALGENRHTLSTIELPAHNHTITDPGHTHRERVGNGANAFILGAGGGANPTVGNGTTTNTVANETGSKTTGITIDNRGGGAAHNTLHPVLGINFIIFTGVL
jgi:microcystin-dependent protein